MPLKGKPMLSMTFWTSLGGICCRIDCSTRSQRLAVSSIRIPVGARRCSLKEPLSTLGKKSRPSQGMNRERAEAACEERNQESAPVVEANLQQVAIAVTKSLEGLFKTLLKSNERITAWCTRFLFISSQQVLGHGGDDRPGKQVRGQHSENHGFGERHKEIPRDAGQQEHRSKHNADRECGHEGGCGDLRCAVEDNFIHVLLWFRLAVAVDVLDLNGRVVYQDANRQSEPTECHNVDRFSNRAKRNDGGQDCQRDGGRDDNGASPTAQKNKNHESGQARGNQRFPDDAADCATNKYGSIGQRCYIELRWNRGLDLRQQCLNAVDYVQGCRVARLVEVQQDGALSVDAHDIRLRGEAIAHPGDIFDVNRSAANRLDRDSVQVGNCLGCCVENGNIIFLGPNLGGSCRQD